MDVAVREAPLGPALVVDGGEDVGVREQVAQREEDALRAAQIQQEVVDQGDARRSPSLRHRRASLLPCTVRYGARDGSVDARALPPGAAWPATRAALLGAPGGGFPDDEWLALVPGRAPVRRPPARDARAHRARRAARCSARRRSPAARGSTAWSAAPTSSGSPRPRPSRCGAPYVLTVHDRSWEQAPRGLHRYERAWHRSPGRARSPAAPPR